MSLSSRHSRKLSSKAPSDFSLADDEESVKSIDPSASPNNPDPAPASSDDQTSPGAMISAAFNSIRTVNAFSLQHHIIEFYETLTYQRAARRMERSLVAGFGFGGSQTMLFLTYSLLFWYGARLINDGK